MEVFVDDMPIKSLNIGDHLKHLQETFDILRKHNMKFSPEKYAFRVISGKFLGFLVSQRLIKVNPDNIKAIEDIPDQLSNVKEVQSLTGRLAALSRFISRSSEKMSSLLFTSQKEEQLRMDSVMSAGFEGFKKVFFKPSIIIETRRRRASADLLSGLGGLELARGLESQVIEIKFDSQLVVNQVYEIFEAKEECMQQYVVKVQDLLARFSKWSITHIPREENREADALANLGSSTEMKG
uniref:Uncharacterized protein LOC104220595 n=1 Tax=Nicotiana sylvestris TaxID=4096 RepID=A0A1U7W589_NICSY|nr:PREDICTED: uncharacterized protein LOC104220595 [Nicotiana sylvestris]